MMRDLQTMLDISLYTDHSYTMSESSSNPSKVSPTSASSSQKPTDNIQELKKSLKLDFDRTQPKSGLATLQTPDIIKLVTLTSPELEKFIISQGVQPVVNTPTPTQLFSPKSVTAEQQEYARGFIDALTQIHQKHGSTMPTLLSPSGFALNLFGAASATGDKKEPLAGTSRLCSVGPLPLTNRFAIWTSNGLQELPADSTLPGVIVCAPKVSPNPKIDTTESSSSVAQAVTTAATATNMQATQMPVSHQAQFQTPSIFIQLPHANSFGGSIPPNGSVFAMPTMVVKREADDPNGAPQFGALLTSPGSSYSVPFPMYSSVTSEPQNTYISLSNAAVHTTNTVPNPQVVGTFTTTAVAPQPQKRSRTAQLQDDLQTVPNIAVHNVAPPVVSRVQAMSVPPTGLRSNTATPIDMTEQELIKLERKRARNRAAATRCRKRKLERIDQLELQLKEQKDRNDEVERSRLNLRQEVAKLRQILADHQKKGCPVQVATAGGLQ